MANSNRIDWPRRVYRVLQARSVAKVSADAGSLGFAFPVPGYVSGVYTILTEYPELRIVFVCEHVRRF